MYIGKNYIRELLGGSALFEYQHMHKLKEAKAGIGSSIQILTFHLKITTPSYSLIELLN